MDGVGVAKNVPTFDGTCQIVPAGSHFIWLRLLEDKKWMNLYQQAMLEVWRAHNLHDKKAPVGVRPRRSTATTTVDAATADAAALNCLGDIVVKRWGGTRTPDLLTRIFLSAEKHESKSGTLLLTSAEEVEFRRNKKDRTALLEQLCCKRLEESGSNQLRDWLNRIWILFVTGIDNDPAGQRALSYDVRKSVHEAHFTNEDAVDLQASLLHFLIPTLKIESCLAIAESDFKASPVVKPTELTGFESSQRRSTPSQQLFTRVFVSFIGCFLDTLTEVEVVKAATIFKPAVWDAQQRILKRPKAQPSGRKKSEDASVSKGDGIRIDHLDKLGHRKLIQKFV